MRKLLTLFSILLLSIVLASCNTSKMTFSNVDKWLPKDFDPEKTILLVQHCGNPDGKFNRDMQAYMKKKYPYRFQFTSLKMIQARDGKYADTTLYRYALLWNHESKTNYRYGTNDMYGRSQPHGYSRQRSVANDFSFYDRLNEKSYPKTGKGSSFPTTTFKPVINSIVERYRKS